MKLNPNDILEQLLELNRNGLPKGFGTGHISLDNQITFIKGGCTDITGYPFYGKSLVLKEIMVGLSINHNWRHAVYMPDDGTQNEIMSNLIQKVTGKTVLPNYKNSMTPNEITKIYMSFCDSFVFWAGDSAEPKQFWDFAKNEKCNSAVVDSWNYMAHEGDPISPNYLRKVLSYRNSFMQNNKMHSFIIIHPKNPDPMQVKNGNVQKPTVYDIQGGSEWNNNGRNILVVHKQDRTDYTMPYDISVEKVKPKHVGKLGFVSLDLNWREQRFYENYGGANRYAYGEGEPIEIGKDIDPFISNISEPF
jgi:twinkle protein